MRYRHVAALLILGALLNLAGPVHAQRPQPKSPEERYEDMNKSPFLAATLEWIIPTVGHDYAGDREAGMPAVYLLLGGLGVGFVATGGGHGVGCNHDPGKLCAVLPFVAMAAAGAILGSRVWASVSAWKLANRTNAYYRRRLGLDDAGLALSVTPMGELGLGVSLRL